MVMHAFRTHPFHGRVITQEVAAGWVVVSQSRLSRIELRPCHPVRGRPRTGALAGWMHPRGEGGEDGHGS